MYPKPLYLELLHFQPSVTTLRALQRCVVRTRNYSEDIAAMLAHDNWRYHLIACAALSAVQPSPTATRSLWSAFERDSWVTPQIAATVCACDPDFVANATRRLARASIVHPSQPVVRPIDPIPGATSLEVAPKAFFALVGLLLHERAHDGDLRERIEDFGVQTAWARDREDEDGEQLATSWLALARLARLG
jgi:hypothetical protein